MAATVFGAFAHPTQLKSLKNLSNIFLSSTRLLSASSCQQSPKDGWLSNLLVRKIEPTKESHSRLLSDKEVIYELTTHNVKSQYMDDYMKNYEDFVTLIDKRDDLNCELLGSWLVGVGDQDQALHLWRYTDGYEGIDAAATMLRTDKDYTKLKKDRTPFLRSRRCQYLLGFSFWPQITPRTEHHVYEIRSYMLKPGTVIEWGNNWARGIHYRKENNEPFGGFFSHIGILYNVHHIWAYRSMTERKKTREAAWNKPGWDECVAYTVPLIQHMESRLMLPTPFSPTK